LKNETAKASHPRNDRPELANHMIKIGCCGYPVAKSKYRKELSLVELNSTFYRYPKPSTVVKWREEAPKIFEFTVKAHQDISHRFRLNLTKSRESFGKMKEVCRKLQAHILLVQTPASFRPDRMHEAESFFRNAERDNLIVVWETRGSIWEEAETRALLRTLLEELDVPHVTDLFRSMPVYAADVAYLRLHGHGERMYYYQYKNEELEELYRKTRRLDTASRQVYVLFNNLSMFEDAKRFRAYVETGRFPPLAEEQGKKAVKALMNRTRYPATKGMLINKLGWRIVELDEGKQLRLEELLKNVPSRMYKSPDEVLKELQL
jgi:uncharacterized protein YecE (DUF72 family)